ncbi:MAG: hypothetical protein H6683_05525 [Deltaproteobacteria bacterium]|nr:hypothetical protein [Deltaproteobacteria bacterium]
MSTGMISDVTIDEDELTAFGAQVHKIGDCAKKRARNFREAIMEGYQTAMAL